MIYDIFAFSGENSLLDIRLNTLYDIVDYFVIGESEYSHSGIKKGFNFKPDEKFKDKILYYKVPYPDELKNISYLYADFFGRDFTFKSLKETKNLEPDDIIIHGDLDEIPNPEVLKVVINNLNQPTTLLYDYFMFCLDLYSRPDNATLITKNKWITQPLHSYRNNRNNLQKTTIKSGWHFSSVGTLQEIVNKLTNFAHSNEIHDKFKNTEYIKSQIIRKAPNWDDKAESNVLQEVEHKFPLLPQYVVDNERKFKHLFYKSYLN